MAGVVLNDGRRGIQKFVHHSAGKGYVHTSASRVLVFSVQALLNARTETQVLAGLAKLIDIAEIAVHLEVLMVGSNTGFRPSVRTRALFPREYRYHLRIAG